MTNTNLVEAVDRVALVNSTCQHVNYTVAITVVSDRAHIEIVPPSEEDINLAALYRDFLLSRFSSPSEIEQIKSQPDADLGYVNGVLFTHYVDRGWCYRSFTWVNPFESFPKYGETKWRFDSLAELINFKESSDDLNRWSKFHSEQN